VVCYKGGEKKKIGLSVEKREPSFFDPEGGQMATARPAKTGLRGEENPLEREKDNVFLSKEKITRKKKKAKFSRGNHGKKRAGNQKCGHLTKRTELRRGTGRGYAF